MLRYVGDVVGLSMDGAGDLDRGRIVLLRASSIQSFKRGSGGHVGQL